MCSERDTRKKRSKRSRRNRHCVCPMNIKGRSRLNTRVRSCSPILAITVKEFKMQVGEMKGSR